MPGTVSRKKSKKVKSWGEDERKFAEAIEKSSLNLAKETPEGTREERNQPSLNQIVQSEESDQPFKDLTELEIHSALAEGQTTELENQNRESESQNGQFEEANAVTSLLGQEKVKKIKKKKSG